MHHPIWGRGHLMFWFWDHTRLDIPHAVGLLWTGIVSSQRPLPGNTQHPCPRRNSNPYPSKRSATDSCLRPCGQRDRIIIIFFSMAWQPHSGSGLRLCRAFKNTLRQPDNTQHSQETDIWDSNPHPSKRADTELRLRPRGYRNRVIINTNLAK